LLVAALATSVQAKGATTTITLKAGNLAAPISLVDPNVVAKFQVWAGPGVTITRFGVATEQTEGFIIDWQSRVTAPPDGLPQYEVAFYVDKQRVSEDQPVYVVSYVHDAAAGRGYVYLPGKGDGRYAQNSQSMFHGHGLEGNWFRATDAWVDAVRPLLAK
jgi:hypothetical protein